MAAVSFASKVKSTLKRYPAIKRTAARLLNQVRSGRIRRLTHWLLAGHVFRYTRIKRWLRNSAPRYLQVGGGRHLIVNENWLNGDWIAGDIYLCAGKRLPFPDDSIDVVFTEQFIEHLSQPDALHFLNEAYRVLVTGGLLRQSTPDLEKLVAVYRNENNEVSLSVAVARHMRNHRQPDLYARPTGAQFLNDMFRLWGHQFIYDRECFRRITEEAGFTDFCWVTFGNSNVACLRQLERHADEEWMRNGIVMIAEGVKTT